MARCRSLPFHLIACLHRSSGSAASLWTTAWQSAAPHDSTTHYRIDARIRPDSSYFDVSVEMRFVPETPTDTLRFLLHDALKLQAGMAALERLSDLVDTTPETGGDRDEVPVGPVELDEVRFTYPDAEEPALRDLSLRIEPGETAALVGSSGAGKSTVANLIGRFWDPQEGRVTIDGNDLRSFKLEALREHIALVPQAPTLFSGTVADNIRYAKPDASDEAIRRAAEMANAHGFIRHSAPAKWQDL